ncbi:50S ribosomal protein L17 [Candidatus Collierbacteria bacterium RIFCSPLOWO2_01_FULL_50_23]|uniref:50S ribosomal protein L17 n=2 Tax=Candidatus Collieribacteriota TaxID=1752725 RepID=A0A1F5EWK5_9BACT|nr:MAG: 50S ribosomal protein L17 [Candidatus Collierbacteria bacterium RIFCSPHIGHO2_02_FULL_49_10]OGD72172.1 MAG: 50S ribosomal protein L17 [Candidatus Collierbacteria bacterium RIFCSPHIGHO2_01_FULL_50_25]OGD74960.1 MAG: 50S ribosomal protein L17 [Candidatus Collierbacteria bacterium RIFCSPLOWO2_01_FULL_50_23]
MKLSRNYNQRKALVRTQLNALISNGQITTTQSKAKLIKPIVDRLITKAKVGSVHARRQLAAYLASIPSANRLVDVIVPLFADKKSGFTSLTKIKIRKGDGTVVSNLRLLADLPKPVKEEAVKKAKGIKKEEPRAAAKKVKTKK